MSAAPPKRRNRFRDPPEPATSAGQPSHRYLLQYSGPFATWITARGQRCFPTLKTAKADAAKRKKKIERANRKAEKDWRPGAYGTSVVPAYRVIDTRRRGCGYYPGTEADDRDWGRYLQNYTDPADPSWCGPRGKPPC